MPILVGTDGIEKMSKSLGNYIGVYEPADEIFGKIMSIPDDVLIDYFRLLTTIDRQEIRKIENDIKEDRLNPSFAKRNLAKIIIGNLHSKDEAKKAEANFNLIFKKKKAPDKIEEYVINVNDFKNKKISIVKLLNDSSLSASKSEARRLITQGGIKIGSERVDDVSMEIDLDDLNNKVIQKGKRYFRKIVLRY